MNSQRRNRSNLAGRVEDLEDRVAPSALGSFSAWRGMMRTAARSPAEVPRATPFQFAQSPARSFGPGVTSSPGIHPAPAARFPAYLASRVNPTPQPTWNAPVVPQMGPNAVHAAMRTNPPNTPSAPVTPTTGPETPPTTSPTTPSASDETPPAPLPPNFAGPLNTLYQDFSGFIVDHPDGSYSPPPNLGFPVVNGQVGVNVSGNGQGDFSAFVTSLQDLGMSVSSTNAVTWTVSGMLPIGALAAVAENSQTLSVAPRYAPVSFGGPMRF